MDERRVLNALEVPLAATEMTLLVGILDEKVDYVICSHFIGSQNTSIKLKILVI